MIFHYYDRQAAQYEGTKYDGTLKLTIRPTWLGKLFGAKEEICTYEHRSLNWFDEWGGIVTCSTWPIHELDLTRIKLECLHRQDKPLQITIIDTGKP